SKSGFAFPSATNSASQYDNPEVMLPRQPNLENMTAHPPLNGQDAPLERIGLSLFSGSPSTVAPVGDVPVPSEYTVGAG
ncbi:hypothetical protein, partial [Vibrio cholerae]|uniref:hypothetical protein n=1 Tax=Vibrio cholerae TaxID=666 RepID=UPI0018F06253